MSAPVLADVSTWVPIVVAVVGLLFGAVLGGIATITDRWQGNRARRGDLAAVGVRHGRFEPGSMRVPAYQTGPTGEWIMNEPSIDFPITVTNGSGEKITSVEFGIRWLHDDSEVIAGFVAVLLSEEELDDVAQEGYDEATFEPWDFESDWLSRLEFFVWFTDQRGRRHENVLRHRPTPSWTSRPITG